MKEWTEGIEKEKERKREKLDSEIGVKKSEEFRGADL